MIRYFRYDIQAYVCVFIGVNCQEDINECLSNPCLNGATCLEGVNTYDCLCPAGFHGSHCESEIDECSYGYCKNFAFCQDLFNAYRFVFPTYFFVLSLENITGGWKLFKVPMRMENLEKVRNQI